MRCHPQVVSRFGKPCTKPQGELSDEVKSAKISRRKLRSQLKESRRSVARLRDLFLAS